MSDLERVLDKYVRQLRTSPEPARMFIITALFKCINEYCSKDLRSTLNKKYSMVKDVIEECMSLVGNDAACLSAVVGHTVGLVERSKITSQEGYSMLMAGMASGNVIVHVVSNGIMDMYEMSIGTEESPSLVHAWVLEPESAVTFVSRIEAFLIRSTYINRETILEYWRGVHLFLAALMMRPGVSKGKDMVSILDVGARVRSMLVRLGCHGKISSHDVVEFLIKAMLSYDVTDCKRAEELEACTLDIVDVLLLSENDEGHDVIPKFLQACFIVSIECLEAGRRATVYLEAITHFLPEFGSCCYDMIVPLVIRGMECGESQDAEVCFTVAGMILNSPDALLGHDESDVVHLLSMVECGCVRAKFYAQKPRLKQSIQFCISRIHTLLNKFHDVGATRMVEWDGDVFCWIQKVSIAPLCVMNEDDVFHVDLVYTRVLCLLRHPRLSVRRRVLEDAFISLAEEPRFSFYALPVLLERLERFDIEIQDTVKKEQGIYMRDLLYSLAALSRTPSAVPFIVRALTPFGDPQSPSGLQGVACSILRRMWLESRKGYSSLKLMILSCDMEDGVEIRADIAHRWVKDVPPQEKVGVAAALVSICRDDPGKAKDVVHAIHACMCSKHTCLASSGLACIALLCESGVLDFIKSWNVVRRVIPDLPDDDVVAASWIGLIACVLKEDPEIHSELMRNTINLLWEASAHASDLVRVQAYRALEKLDWDISEDLETLRPPIEYATLLEQEEPDSKSLEDCSIMMVKILELEYLDRRKQFIQLSSTLSNLSKQSHNSRFYKLSNAIPNYLLKEATGGRNNFMKSGSESEMFVMLYLWQPAGKKTLAEPEMYRRVADDMLSKDSSVTIDLLIDFENINVLCEGWELMYRRWISAFFPEDIVEMSEYHKYTSEIDLIWQQITKDNRLSEKVLNPIIVIAISSFVRVFGRVESQYVLTSYTWITGILDGGSQFNSLQTVSLIALGRILGHVRQSLGSSVESTAMNLLLSGDERLGGARDFALQFCTDKTVSLNLAQQAFDHLMDRVRHIFPSLQTSFPRHPSNHENQALKSFGCLVCQTNAFDFINLRAVLSDIEDIFASGSHEYVVPGLCDLYCSIAIKLFEESQLNDSQITKCLDMMSSLCGRESLAKYVGDISLALSKLLVESLKNGYIVGNKWNMDSTIEFMKELLSKVHKYPCIQSNAGGICRGLGHCLEYQMYNQKNINESFVQENRAETVIDTICHMESSNAVRMGCIPHISRICHMAIEFRTRFETDSFESMSGSAVGYLSEALISQQWPLGKEILHKQSVMTLLSCLSHAPKLPQKDWSACLRRYLKMFQEDLDVQMSIVKFICSHATGSIAEKVRDFICIDALNLDRNALQPTTLMLEALCYIFCHFSDIIPVLSDDQVLLHLNSLDNAFSIDERRSKLIAFSLAFGLQKFVTEVDNISQTSLAYELMIQVLLPRVDMSSRFHAPLCALYSLSDEELAAVALRREDWIFEDDILVETSEINIERNASIAACLLRAFRGSDTATQLSITQNEALFKMHPVHHSWISCGLIQSLGLQSMQQSLYHIMACVSPTDTSIAHHLMSNMAHGIRVLVRNSQPSKSKDVLTWLADIFGDEEKYTEKTETNTRSPVLSQLAVMCIAACFAGEVGDSAAYDLSLDESIVLLPKALRHFMKHHPSHQSVYRHLIHCLDDIDRPNMELIRVFLSTLYLDHSNQSDWLDILQACS